MSSWDFRPESKSSQGITDPASGTEAGAGFKAGQQPAPFADVKASKRNVIVTDKGWVRRQIRNKSGSAVRVIDEVLVAANPGVTDGYANINYTFAPDIAEVHFQTGTITANAVCNVYVVFNAPLSNAVYGTGDTLSLTVANTVGGNHAVFFSNNDVGLLNANNTLVFQNRAGLQGGTGSASATYTVNAQSISVSGNPLLLATSLASNTSANLVISGAVSNIVSTATVSV